MGMAKGSGFTILGAATMSGIRNRTHLLRMRMELAPAGHAEQACSAISDMTDGALSGNG